MSLLPNPDVYRHPPAILVSPGLYRDEAETPAFEVKFLLTTAEALEVGRRLRLVRIALLALGLRPLAGEEKGYFHVTSLVVGFDLSGAV